MHELFQRIEPYRNLDYVGPMLEELKSQKFIYVFGGGIRAGFVANYLEKRGIGIQGILVNKKYLRPNFEIAGYKGSSPVLCAEDVLEKGVNINIVCGLSKSLIDNSIFNIDNVKMVYHPSMGILDSYHIDWNILMEHKEGLAWIYERLEDNYSRDCMVCHLSGRLSGMDLDFKRSPWSDPEYYLDDIMSWDDYECVVDCGAFDGDGIREFLRKKPKHVKYKYYALEADTENYEIMLKNEGSNGNVVFLNKAVYSKECRLNFVEGSDTETGSVSEGSQGGISVEADAIDHIVGEDVLTFIKMDIEGSEMDALVGAKNQIVNNKPKLAICMYHRQEDWWTIPQYIHSLRSDYKMYLKTHSSMPTELVLFCI